LLCEWPGSCEWVCAERCSAPERYTPARMVPNVPEAEKLAGSGLNDPKPPPIERQLRDRRRIASMLQSGLGELAGDSRH
jgi:hypothetical protein